MLALLILSYRQTIKAYPSAGGAYIVIKDNFGIGLAQVAGVALLIGYILTVAVSVAAGAAALASAFPALSDYVVPIALGFIALIAFGNLRGVRESGKLFAGPTYFFMLNMAAPARRRALGSCLTATWKRRRSAARGSSRSATPARVFVRGRPVRRAARLRVRRCRGDRRGGHLQRRPRVQGAGVEERPHDARDHGDRPRGHVPRASRSSPRRCTPPPSSDGTPTVSQPDRRVRLRRPARSATSRYFALQAGTMLILVLAANTSFADFPRLASFHAGDSFMPRQLTKRGHRLVFSNGIIALSLASVVLVIATGAKVEQLIPPLRDRRVHRLHALPGGHGQAPLRPTGSRDGARASSSTASGASSRSSWP